MQRANSADLLLVLHQNNGSVNNPEDAQARAMRDMLIEEIETE